MIGKIEKKEGKIIVKLKLRVPGVPIKDMLADLVRESVKAEVDFSIMNDSEKEKFFILVRKNLIL